MVLGDRMEGVQPGDALAAPPRRQPDAHRVARPALRHRGEGRALRMRALRREVLRQLDLPDGDRARLGDDDQGGEQPSTSASCGDPSPARRSQLHLERWLAPSALPPDPPSAPRCRRTVLISLDLIIGGHARHLFEFRAATGDPPGNQRPCSWWCWRYVLALGSAPRCGIFSVGRGAATGSGECGNASGSSTAC